PTGVCGGSGSKRTRGCSNSLTNAASSTSGEARTTSAEGMESRMRGTSPVRSRLPALPPCGTETRTVTGIRSSIGSRFGREISASRRRERLYPVSHLSGTRWKRIAGQQVQDGGGQHDQRVGQRDEAHTEIEGDERDRITQEERQRQKGEAQGCVSNAPRVPKAFRDASVRVDLVRLDGVLEDRLRERVQHAGAEQTDEDARRELSPPEVHRRPDEVHDDAEVRELDAEPHVGPA